VERSDVVILGKVGNPLGLQNCFMFWWLRMNWQQPVRNGGKWSMRTKQPPPTSRNVCLLVPSEYGSKLSSSHHNEWFNESSGNHNDQLWSIPMCVPRWARLSHWFVVTLYCSVCRWMERGNEPFDAQQLVWRSRQGVSPEALLARPPLPGEPLVHYAF
jgi:hypothetical protein